MCHFAKSLNAFKFNHLSQMLKIESTSDFCVHWAPHLDISSCHPLPIIHWLFIKILHISYTPFSKEKICTRWPENFKIKDKHSSVKWNDINIIFKLISLETSQFFFFFSIIDVIWCDWCIINMLPRTNWQHELKMCKFQLIWLVKYFVT